MHMNVNSIQLTMCCKIGRSKKWADGTKKRPNNDMGFPPVIILNAIFDVKLDIFQNLIDQVT
jgi:hypothetical protein